MIQRRSLLLLTFLTCGAAVSCPRAAHSAPLTPNDPYYSFQKWYADALGLPAAWGYSLGSPSVKVAMLDTGVIPTTPDLSGRVLPPLSATGSAPLDGTQIHHGTWVSSVIASGVNNSSQIAGVGNFTILPVTITTPSGTNTSEWIADGIRLAADNGAKVINVSHSTLTYGELDDAAAYAKTKGALVFVAAGNDNRRVDRTGLDNLIFVSGTDYKPNYAPGQPDPAEPLDADARWQSLSGLGSSWGPYIDLAAPAERIVIADPLDPALQPAGLGVIDGTSFAAPFAGGAAALAWSINPNLTPDQVRDMLYSTATDLGDPGWDEVFGHGRVNIGAVAAAAAATVPEPSSLLVAAAASITLLRRRRK